MKVNKKVTRVFTKFALFLALTAGVVTACKDYDDDIDDLRGQINDLSGSFTDLKNQFNAGKLITDVSPEGPDGEVGFKITFSDNSSIIVKNGQKGAEGKSYKWEIRNDFWFLNDEPTGIKAKGDNGADAGEWTINADGFWCYKDVATNVKAKGENGIADKWTIGADGFWYCNGVKSDTRAEALDGGKPGTDGISPTIETVDGVSYWVVEGKRTDIVVYSPVEGTIIAEKDSNGDYNFYVLGADGKKKEGFTFPSLSKTITSVVFIPKNYLDGIEAIILPTYLNDILAVEENESGAAWWVGRKHGNNDNSDISLSVPSRVKDYKYIPTGPHRVAQYTDVTYRLNAQADLKDFDKPVFVNEKATNHFRSQALEGSLVSIGDYKLDPNGRLVMNVKANVCYEEWAEGTLLFDNKQKYNTVGGDQNKDHHTTDASGNKNYENIDIVALKVPVKAATGVDAKDVYSDYQRIFLTEYDGFWISNNPENPIAWDNAGVHMLKAYYPANYGAHVYSTQTTSGTGQHQALYNAYEGRNNHTSDAYAVWNKTTDLNDYVTVSWGGPVNANLQNLVNSLPGTGAIAEGTIEPKDLGKYGLGLYYYLGNDEYNVAHGTNILTDQQNFGAVTPEGIFNSRVYGETDRRGAIGRTPIVRIELRDTTTCASNRLIAVGYMRVQIIEEPKTINVPHTFETIVADCPSNLTFNFDVDSMNIKVYNRIGIEMRPENFHATYSNFVPGEVWAYWNNGADSLLLRGDVYDRANPAGPQYTHEIDLIPRLTCNIWGHDHATQPEIDLMSILYSGKDITIKANPSYTDGMASSVTINFVGVITAPKFKVNYQAGSWEGGTGEGAPFETIVSNVAVPTVSWHNGMTLGGQGGQESSWYTQECVFGPDLDHSFVRWDATHNRPSGVERENHTKLLAVNPDHEVSTCFERRFIFSPKRGEGAVTINGQATDVVTTATMSYLYLAGTSTLVAQIYDVDALSVIPGTHSGRFFKSGSIELINCTEVKKMFSENANITIRGIELIAQSNSVTTQNHGVSVVVKTFNVRFMRPMQLPIVKELEVRDAVIGGSTTVAWDIPLKDWNGQDVRPYTTANPAGRDQGLWRYYDVQTISCTTFDIANVVSNIVLVDGNEVVRGNITTPEDAIAANTIGMPGLARIECEALNKGVRTFTYYNETGFLTENYTLWIPVTIEYHWGVMHTYQRINVKVR